jgi:glycosyltransferase involved in cell wall biosynthesis
VVGEGVDEVHEYPRKAYDEQIILFVGIDFERKGGPTLLRAFAEVTSRRPGTRLRVVGSPPGRAQQGVEWLGHIADRHQIHALFSQATVFAMPSLCEPFGLVLIEAMSHGLPVVGTTVDAMGEIVEEGKTGFLVPKGDVEALAQRLVQLLESPALCASMGEAGRLRVQERFLWAHVISRIEDGLREIT